MLELLTLIAQDTPPPVSPCGQPGFLFPLAMMAVVFYFLLIRPQSRDKKRRAEMIKAIKKNDRVVTIGGIVGTVVSVKDDDITLKVDESSNTKITFTRSAIQRVTSGEGTDSAGGEKK
jgi:preprotein translocase subunit YajC